jgi:hypothetical protein
MQRFVFVASIGYMTGFMCHMVMGMVIMEKRIMGMVMVMVMDMDTRNRQRSWETFTWRNISPNPHQNQDVAKD